MTPKASSASSGKKRARRYRFGNLLTSHLSARRRPPASRPALVLLARERKSNAAFALADLLSRRGLERPCETLVAWGRSEA